MRGLGLWIGVTSCLVALSSCGSDECNADFVDCGAPFDLRVEIGADEFEPGPWTYRIVVDTVQITGTCELDAGGCGENEDDFAFGLTHHEAVLAAWHATTDFECALQYLPAHVELDLVSPSDLRYSKTWDFEPMLDREDWPYCESHQEDLSLDEMKVADS